MTPRVLITLSSGLLLLAACASTPKADLELEAARAAIDAAMANRANDCAKETVAAAEAKLREARELSESEDFDGARAAAQEAEALAKQARGESPPGCDEKKDQEIVREDAKTENVAMDFGPIEQTIYFDYNQATIREDSKALLSKIAGQLAGDGKLKIEVEGHCDSRGSTEYNLHLGERRARSVEKYLVTQGVKPTQVAIISYGEERPADLGYSESAHQKNRRAEIKKR